MMSPAKRPEEAQAAGVGMGLDSGTPNLFIQHSVENLSK